MTYSKLMYSAKNSQVQKIWKQMGIKELFVVMARGEGGGRGREGEGGREGGNGNYSLSSLPCLGTEREMKEQKQSQYILIINPQHFKEQGNGKESHMWDVEENRKKRRLPSSNAALERGTPRLLVAFASGAWLQNPALRTLCTLGKQTGPRNYDGIPVNPFNPKE